MDNIRGLFGGQNYSAHDVPLEVQRNKKEAITGIDRVINIFKLDEYGLVTPELNMITQVAGISAFAGVVYGGFMNTRSTYADFVKNNQATIYKNHLEAKRKLQEKYTIQFGKGAFKWGWRLCYFTTTYVAISTCVSTYRNKNGILDHSIAGFLTGLSYKFTMGPRAWIVGAGLGCALGTFAGSLTTLLLHLSGVSMQDIRDVHYRVKEHRTAAERAMMHQYVLKEQLAILTAHNDRVGDAGKTLAALATPQDALGRPSVSADDAQQQ